MRIRRAAQILEVHHSNGTFLSMPVPWLGYFDRTMLRQHCAYSDYQWSYFLVERRNMTLIETVLRSKTVSGKLYITFSGTKSVALWGSVNNYTASLKTSWIHWFLACNSQHPA